jgi:hypothetical protein
MAQLLNEGKDNLRINEKLVSPRIFFKSQAALVFSWICRRKEPKERKHALAFSQRPSGNSINSRRDAALSGRFSRPVKVCAFRDDY